MVDKLKKKDPSEMSRDEWCRYFNLDPDESWEDYQREKRNKVIKTIITVVVGVGISTALMFISEDIIASIILGAGFIFF